MIDLSESIVVLRLVLHGLTTTTPPIISGDRDLERTERDEDDR